MCVSCFLVGNKPPQVMWKGAQLSASDSWSSYLTALGEWLFIVIFYSTMYNFFFFLSFFFFCGLLLLIGNCEVFFSVRFTEIILPTRMVRKPSGFF